MEGDGLIQLRELEHVMRACMEENGMKFSDEQIEDLTIALFEDADQGNRGAITFEALKRQLEKHNGLLENLSIRLDRGITTESQKSIDETTLTNKDVKARNERSIDRWLVPPQPKPTRRTAWGAFSSLRPYQLTKPYMKNNYVYIAFISMFVLVNVALFVSRLYEYRRHNGYVMLARACGKFDFVFPLRGVEDRNDFAAAAAAE